MKKKVIKNLLLLILWIITIIFTSVWVYENPEPIRILKNYLKKNKIVKANSFNIKIDKIISLSKKTAFILYEKNFSKFNPSLMKIFTQDGHIIENSKFLLVFSWITNLFLFLRFGFYDFFRCPSIES